MQNLHVAFTCALNLSGWRSIVFSFSSSVETILIYLLNKKLLDTDKNFWKPTKLICFNLFNNDVTHFVNLFHLFVIYFIKLLNLLLNFPPDCSNTLSFALISFYFSFDYFQNSLIAWKGPIWFYCYLLISK